MNEPRRRTNFAIAALILLLAAFGIAFAVYSGLKKGAAKEGAAEEEEETAGGLFVSVDKEAQKKIGLATQTVEFTTFQPHLTAYGVIEEDPSRSLTVRSPVAGFLRAQSDWPQIGARIAAGTKIGEVEPRLSPMDQLQLQNQQIEAESSVAETQAELDAANSSYESKKSLGAGTSERQVEEAEARKRSAEARHAAAKRKLDLVTAAREDKSKGLAPIPLEVGRSGEVIDVSAGPGEAVESGQAILRITEFDRVLARIDIPPGESWTPASEPARVWRAGDEKTVYTGQPLGPAPRSGTQTGGVAWLLSIKADALTLRPGTPVVAHLPLAGQPLKGAIIPESAILRFEGLTWVFVQESNESFERRRVELNTPTPQGWFVTSGLEPDDDVVILGAQVLLSEQHKSTLEGEAEAAE